MKSALTAITLSVTFLASVNASAQLGRPAPAPDTLILAESLNFESGASSNFQSMMIQLLDEYYAVGACEAANDWATCDDLRFGFAINAGKSCNDTADDGPLTWFYTPDEDGGIDVKARIQGIHGERNGGGRTYCNNDNFINHDTGLDRAWNLTFPGTTSATFADLAGDASDPDNRGFWTRPHLNFFAVKNLPKSADGSNGGRVLRSLQTACRMFKSQPVIDDNGTATTTDDLVLGNLPSMPTWVLVERSANSAAHLYGGMVAAAGGTGECQIKQGDWVDLEMCNYVNSGVTEATLRAGIASGATNNPPNGAYRCGGSGNPDKSSFSTGGLAASSLPAMRCHLSGTTQGQCTGSNTPTNLLGVFKCVRQLPFGISAPPPGPDNDYVVRYCPNGIPDDDIFDPSCVVLRESQGDIQFVDDGRTLFVITGLTNCDGGDVETFECPTGTPCDTGGVGRCADGTVVCPDGQPVCKPAFEDYPEICNGLDDDCDGKVDNIRQSWRSPLYVDYTLPLPEHSGKDCNLIDVCFCPDGATDLKAGSNFEEYLDSWGGACQCGEGLAPDYSPMPDTEPTSPSSDEPTSACAAVADGSVPLSFVGLALLGFAGLVRRRRN